MTRISFTPFYKVPSAGQQGVSGGGAKGLCLGRPPGQAVGLWPIDDEGDAPCVSARHSFTRNLFGRARFGVYVLADLVGVSLQFEGLRAYCGQGVRAKLRVLHEL